MSGETMPNKDQKYFFSYARKDSGFVRKLAEELRSSGVNLWLDQLDIVGGEHWDRAVENALNSCKGMILVLSADSVNSNNVMDEVSYALEEGKRIIPVRCRDCDIPFRLRRVQYIDFTIDYEKAFKQLLTALGVDQPLQSLNISSPEDSTAVNYAGLFEETNIREPEIKQQEVGGEPAISSTKEVADITQSDMPLGVTKKKGRGILSRLFIILLLLGATLIAGFFSYSFILQVTNSGRTAAIGTLIVVFAIAFFSWKRSAKTT